jgi:hypothetical protein
VTKLYALVSGLLLIGFVAIFVNVAAAAPVSVLNGTQFTTTTGALIQAHGGGVIKVGPYYYWFGENRNPNSTFFAVSCYRSTDLKNWEFRNNVLTANSAAELNPANIERPKVVYNANTGRYVMWMHWENGVNYGEARAAVASSATVDGNYTYHGSFRPLANTGVVDHGKPGYMSRDCTLFVDSDGTGYFISAANENADLGRTEARGPGDVQAKRLLFPPDIGSDRLEPQSTEIRVFDQYRFGLVWFDELRRQRLLLLANHLRASDPGEFDHILPVPW